MGRSSAPPESASWPWRREVAPRAESGEHASDMATGRRGHLLIGQAGGATAVINASLVGAVREALAADAVDGIYGARHGIEGVLARDLLDLRGESAATWQGLLTTPSAALGSLRANLHPADPARPPPPLPPLTS